MVIVMDKKENKKVVRKISKEKLTKFIIWSLVVLITILIALVIIVKFKENKKASDGSTEVNIESKIEEYGYELTDLATSYYKGLFKELKALLNDKNHDEKQYATLVSQLFITDFYNLNNKLTSSDIGGIQYVYKDYRNAFKAHAQGSIYKSIQTNIYGDRKQELPVINKVTIDSIDQTTFKYNKTSDPKAYKVDASITYEKDLGYPTKIKLVLIHNDKNIEIAKMD